MAVQLTVKNNKIPQLRARLAEINALALTIGFQGDEARLTYDNGRINLPTVALYNEFGTRTIPQRSFLRSSIFERRVAIQKIVADEIGRYINDFNTTASVALGRAGAKIVAIVAEKIRRSKGWAKRNAPSTVQNKGFDYPLHETGLLARSVTWAVRRQGQIIAKGRA